MFSASLFLKSSLARIVLRGCAFALCALILCGCQFIRGGRETGQEIVQVTSPSLALLLPTSGPYAAIAGKIRKGAEAARQELQKKGITVQLKNINTNAADWLAQVSRLAPEYAVVGGPLQDKNYLALRKAGLLQQRVYFAFLPTLAQGDEGKLAWRFFPSQQDQIDALVNFATDKLGIRTYGAFYPSDNYGKRMVALLEQSLGRRQMPLQKATYNPAAPAGMAQAIKPLINPHPGASGANLVPQTAFEALFVPDSWKRMEMVSRSLAANGEQRLVLLGPGIWEQGLAGRAVPGADRYKLAVFPSAYSSAHAPAIVRKSGNDLWTAMGYDFVNFGARLALGARPTSVAQINALAQKAQGAVRALAPMRWDDSGLGHESMYLFQVGSTGALPLNLEQFRKTRQSIAERATLRMQGFGHINPDTGEVLEPSQQEEVALPPEHEPQARPVSAEAVPAPRPEPVANPQPALNPAPQPAVQSRQPQEQGIMRATPRSSYKLSLPTR